MYFNHTVADIFPDHYDLRQVIKEARACFDAQSEVRSPFFDGPVVFTSDGFNHLTHKTNRVPRNVNEQRLKLRLIRIAINIIRNAGTVQEYRKILDKIGEPDKSGFTKMKEIEYWAFHDIVDGKNRLLIRVILRRVGDGKLHFWSIMPHGKLDKQKIYQDGIETE